jgi:plastocyanin
MRRTFAMRAFAWTYWALVMAIAAVLAVIILPASSSSSESASFTPLFGAFLVACIVGAAVATLMKTAPRRPGPWLGLIVVPVINLVIVAPFIPNPVTPLDLAFSAALPLIVSTIVLIVLGTVAFRDAGNPGTGSWDGPRARMALALVAGLTVGGTAAGYLAAISAGRVGGSTLAATPTRSATLFAENTEYSPGEFEMATSEVLGLFVQNKDSIAHSFDIDSLDIHVQIPANSTVAVAIDPTAAGTLEFYCAIPGHRQAGMNGIITVR